MFNFFHKMVSPRYFYHISTTIIPWFIFPAIVLMVFGAINGLFIAPPDYQQGDAYRIIYVHVPSAYISMLAYSLMAITSMSRLASFFFCFSFFLSIFANLTSSLVYNSGCSFALLIINFAAFLSFNFVLCSV